MLPVTRYARGLRAFERQHGHMLAVAWFNKFCREAPKDQYTTIDTFLRNPSPWKPEEKRVVQPE
jgi:hypothetical protein